MRVEGDKVYADNVMFGSDAQNVGIDFDWEILHLEVEADRPPKQLMFIPALALLALGFALGRRGTVSHVVSTNGAVFDQAETKVLNVAAHDSDTAGVLIRETDAEGIAFPVNVSTGANTALNHYDPALAPTKLGPGDLLLFDFGACVGGYRSDMTRTVCVGQADARAREIYDIVLRANRDYFRGAANVQRVRAWRAAHPGYWQRTAQQTEVALQADSLAQPIESKRESPTLVGAALQDLLCAQPFVELIANLTGTALQDVMPHAA